MHLPKTQTLLILATLSLLFPRPAIAQQLPTLPLEFNPRELGNPGRPGGRRRGGGSRGACSAGLPLSAIAYADTQIVTELGITNIEELVGMWTTQAQPSLWFYMPQSLANIPTEFILKDSSGQLLYQGELVGSTDGNGIVAAPLPIALSLDTPYQWSLTIDCDQSDRTTVRGWIERQLPSTSLTNDLGEASDRNRAALYANAGFLQDALTELAILRNAQPDDDAITQDWRSFLIALDFPELVNVPVLDCCIVGSVAAEEVPDEVPDEVPEERAPTEEPPAEKLPAEELR
ncbi:MAG: DUF928 domain-containing protein [Cyanobacteria bacterium P01_D01_bin.1]